MLQRIIQRMMRIIRLDTQVYREIQQDRDANLDAALIVLVVSVLAALGAAIGSGGFVRVFLLRLISGILLNWLLWSYATLFVGTRFYGGQADFAGMARTLGYAYAPTVLGILGGLAGMIGWALSLAAGYFATREVLDLRSEKAIITVAVGWVVVLVVSILLWSIL